MFPEPTSFSVGTVASLPLEGGGFKVCLEGELVPCEKPVGPRDLKQGVIDKLSTHVGESKKFEKAVKEVQKSLDPELGATIPATDGADVDPIHLDTKYGKKVFDHERHAVSPWDTRRRPRFTAAPWRQKVSPLEKEKWFQSDLFCPNLGLDIVVHLNHLEELIKKTAERIIIISPFLEFNERIKELLANKDRMKIDVRIVCGRLVVQSNPRRCSFRLTKRLPLPITTWSSNSILSSLPADTRSRVILTSSGLGVGSPEG